jgi:hypothetical protein
MESQAQFSAYDFFPNVFRTNIPDNSIVVVINSSGRNSKVSPVVGVQFLVRNTKMQDSERIAYEIFEFLNYKTNFLMNTVLITMCRSAQPAPIYTGKDENNRHIYSINFEITM